MITYFFIISFTFYYISVWQSYCNVSISLILSDMMQFGKWIFVCHVLWKIIMGNNQEMLVHLIHSHLWCSFLLILIDLTISMINLSKKTVFPQNIWSINFYYSPQAEPGAQPLALTWEHYFFTLYIGRQHREIIHFYMETLKMAT